MVEKNEHCVTDSEFAPLMVGLGIFLPLLIEQE